MCVEGHKPIDWLIEQYELLDKHFLELGIQIRNDHPNLFCDAAARLLAKHHRVMHDAIRQNLKILREFKEGYEDPMPEMIAGLARGLIEAGVIKEGDIIFARDEDKPRPRFDPNIN